MIEGYSPEELEAARNPKKLKIFFPISDNGSGNVKRGYAACLLPALNSHGIVIRTEEMSGSHADRQCNNMANALLRTDCDAMLIVDCDTILRHMDIARTIAHMLRGVKAVWGLYPKKQDDCPPCVNTWPEVPPPDEFGLINVRRSGRGFLCVARGVFEALKEENGGPARKFFNHGEPEWAFFRSGVVDGIYSAIVGGGPEWISEDWHFCEDIRIHLGIPTLVDTGIVLKHVGEKTYEFPADRVMRVVKSWRDIHGWFDYEDVYRRIVEEIPETGAFVEVGSWMGRSICAFSEYAKEAHKSPFVFAVDTFQGERGNNIHRAILAQHGGNVRKMFDANLKTCGVQLSGVIQKDSAEAAGNFEDGSLDAVFIDAAHDLESVRNDILAWRPKVKPGGILCGHDYDTTTDPGVVAAVDEQLQNVEIIGRCWWVKV